MDRLRILFVGFMSGKKDEGISILTDAFYTYFQARHDVLMIDSHDLFRAKTIIRVLKFNPHIVHHLIGPTLRSLIACTVVKGILALRAKTVISATRPFFSSFDRRFVGFFKPDIVLTQASKWEKLFKEKGIVTRFVSNPVDTKKFRTLTTDKADLRRKYGLPSGKKLLLHVGHLRSNRNIQFLREVQDRFPKDKLQVVVVASTFFGDQDSMKGWLESKGCIVISKYIDAIEEIYNACDYYLFPMKSLETGFFPTGKDEIGVIDLPLSILEALSCGLPVVTPEIDSLQQLAQRVPGLPILELEPLSDLLERMLTMADSWDKVAHSNLRDTIDSTAVFSEVEDVYRSLCGTG